MSQLTFKFPFTIKYYEQDFYVSSNNFSAYKLIESWPKWPGKWVNVFGESGSGKTHLSKILEKKIKKIKILDAKNVNDEIISNLRDYECLIIDNYLENIEERLFYSILNQSKQHDNYFIINSLSALNKKQFKLNDLQSRINSFVFIGINLPTDDLLKVIITKNFSDKQISLSQKSQIILLKMSIDLMKKSLNFLRMLMIYLYLLKIY